MAENLIHNPHIVIAEDSPTQMELLRFTLENMGYTVHHGENGKKALDLVREIHPLLLISDVMMPEMNGYELTRAIRADQKIQAIPILLLTTLSDLGDILKGLEEGADCYVMKPFNEHYLRSRVNQILENRELLTGGRNDKAIKVHSGGKAYQIESGASAILNLLFSSYESAVYRNLELEDREKELREMNEVLRKKVERRKKELEKELQQVSQAEIALKKSEEKFRNLVNHAQVGIFIWSTEGHIIQSNESFRELLGISEEDAQAGLEVSPLFKKGKGKSFLFKELEKSGTVTEYETEVFRGDGSVKQVLVSAGKEASYISGMILDISARRDAEKRLKIHNNELVEARIKAEESEKLKTAFLANMSNEILNPLNSLLGFADLMANVDASAETLSNHAEQINRSGKHLVNIIESIIDITRVETGELKIRKSSCALNDLMLDLYASFQRVLESDNKKGLELVLKRGSKDPALSFVTEPYRLKRILTNLLENALKYTEQGVIEFGYTIHEHSNREGQDEIQFFVKDTGQGMSQKVIQLLFDRFRQNETSYIKLSEGAGLGLPLTRAYVEVLGGKIWCQSEPKKGSEFYFILPFDIEHEARMPPQKPVLPEENPEIEGHLKILVAEDEESNYILLEALLRELGPTLIWAKNGQDAVNFIRHQKDIDLILMDLRMPVMSGFEAVEQIRKMNQEIPIIVQTAFAREEDREAILNLGCNSFLTKPIRKKDLYGEIHRLSGIKTRT